MTNVVVTKCMAAMTRLARWLCACAVVACIGQRRAVLFTRRVCSAWWLSVGAVPPMRQQLADPAVQLRGQPAAYRLLRTRRSEAVPTDAQARVNTYVDTIATP